MAREQNHAVGCALVSMENTVLLPQVPYHFMLTCNYAETNVLRSSVYDQGKPGSRCDSFGSNYKLEANDCNNLCDIPKGKFDPFDGTLLTTLTHSSLEKTQMRHDPQ